LVFFNFSDNNIYFKSTLIRDPELTDFRISRSPSNFPMILVEDAGLISPVPLIGVGPKNKHNALPISWESY
jgi:hypothetical protein